VILNLVNRFTALQTDSAEKRYLDLLNKPVYLETIPQNISLLYWCYTHITQQDQEANHKKSLVAPGQLFL
jgi:hypothetical protein